MQQSRGFILLVSGVIFHHGGSQTKMPSAVQKYHQTSNGIDGGR
jgi:hypothetical protein